MTIKFERGICCDLNETIAREWLVTNGLGGYAAGTVAGVLTRMQHGLLMAVLPHAVTPQLLLAKIDEEVVFDQRTYYLGTNEYQNGTLSPSGFVHLESFRLENGIPIFTYRLGGLDGIVLEKRIWMGQGQNTTYIQYRILRTTTMDTSSGHLRSGLTGALSANLEGSTPDTMLAQQAPDTVDITLLPFTAYRPYNQIQYGRDDYYFQVQVHANADQTVEATEPAQTRLPAGVAGCTIKAFDDAQPYHLLAVSHPKSQATFIPTGVWYWRVLHKQDSVCDQAATEDLYLPGVIRATLRAGEDTALTVVVSMEQLSSQLYQQDCIDLSYQKNSPQQSWQETQEQAASSMIQDQEILPLISSSNPQSEGLDYLHLLLEAGKRFFASYPVMADQKRRDTQPNAVPAVRSTILLADYYTCENRTRDTLIALPGLTLVSKRTAEAQEILRQLATYFVGGLLPDRLPTADKPLTDSDYSSVDTTLWYFYALDHYLQASRNDSFLEEVFHHLKECIQRYVQGTHNGIRVDPADGLLSASKPGHALTWMNATINGIAVTPRSGKAVEVNALWYHALCLMHEWSEHLNQFGHVGNDASYYQKLLKRCKNSFQQRFWYSRGSYLCDVVDGPAGDDNSLRPNQLFALSLRYPILEMSHRQSVMDSITQCLLTPFGLRTLSTEDQNYQGSLGKQVEERARAFHQGSVWPWLIGAYIDGLLTLCNQAASGEDKRLCQEYLWRKGLRKLEPFRERLSTGLLGMCEGVLEGDSPHKAGPAVASAISTGELLRVYSTLAQLRTAQPEQILSY